MEKKILIVEDDILAATYLCELLEENGYEIVDVVTTGADAIKKAKALSPDLILMDILLKDQVSGCDAAFQISQNNPNIIIIFLTAHADKEMIEYAKKSKASAYLMKPYRDEEILATMSVILFKKQDQYLKKNSYIVKLKNGYSFNLQTLSLSKAKKHIPLTPVKNRLIEILAKNTDIVVPHSQICNFIWGERREPATLRSLVYRTKQVIGEDLINNISGVGYSINSK